MVAGVGIIVVGQLLVEVHVQVEGDVVVSFCLKLQICVVSPVWALCRFTLTRVRASVEDFCLAYEGS